MVGRQCLRKLDHYQQYESQKHLRRSMCRFKCLACRYVFVQFGHGNLPSASFCGIVLPFGEPFKPFCMTGGRPGALGKMPRLP